VLVTNGTYYLTAEIVVTNAITVKSVNGADVTTVDGQNSVRCFNLGTNACTIDGFTIQNGRADGLWPDNCGAGVFCSLTPHSEWPTNPIVSNCTILGNSSLLNASGTPYGGGCFGGRMIHCTISGNSAHTGGGCHMSILNNCTVFDNSAALGGGSDHALLIHCTIFSNSASVGSGCHKTQLQNCILWNNTGSGHNWDNCAFAYSCSPGLSGNGNITNAPFFADAAGRLLPNSPCIDAGTNLTSMVDDIEGTPRPLDGDNNGSAIPDMGAYEYFNAAADSDGDSVTDGDEQIADTNMADSNDWFSVTAFTRNSIVTFDSSDERQYTLQYCANLVDGAWSNVTGQVDITGNGGLDTLTDPAPTNSPCYYRVQVEIP